MSTWVGIGRLTRDPEVRYTQSGKAIASFTLAIDRKEFAGTPVPDEDIPF